MTAEQERLKALHGTPIEFALACINAIGDISGAEARRAIVKYNDEWEAAGLTTREDQ